MSLASLKKNREAVLAKLQDASKSTSKSSSNSDDRFWKPTFDKERGSGGAVVRFLAAPDGEDLPWAKVFRHGFKGPTGKWYLENSLSTIGQDDPVGQLNSRLWNSGVESDKDVAKSQKRKTEYIANVLIVKDPANPENEGKVFLYKFGPMIFEIINSKMFPDEVEGDDPVNPFDLWEGADFVIKIVGKKLGNDLVPNYEKSYFKDSSAVADTDEEIEAIWKKAHSLEAFTAANQFKSYDELSRKLFEVLGPTVGSGVPVIEGVELPRGSSTPARQQEQSAPVQKETAATTESDTDDSLDWLKDMAG